MKQIYSYLSVVFFLCVSSVHIIAQNAITVAGGNGRGSAANQLNAPFGIDVDAAGNIYIADNGNFRVAKWAPGDAQMSVIAGRPNSQSNSESVGPFDVFLDSSNNLYVSNISNQSVMRYAPGDTAGTIVAGGNGNGNLPSQISSPAGLYVDASGTVYVVSYNYANVIKWPPGSTYGSVVVQINSQSGPKDDMTHLDLRDVFVDKEGNLFVADSYSRRILKYPPGSTYPLTGTVVAGGNGQGPAANKLDGPQSVFVDGGGNIYIADRDNNRIQKWALGATSGVTVAGGHGAGSAPNQLNKPVSVVVDAAGNIYVCDQGNDRIQKFPPSGGLSYKYYEGTWSALPDFSKIVPVLTGVSASTDISVRPTSRNDNFAFLWEGYIKIPTTGNYTFETISDDGSKVYFNSQYNFAGAATINNDGLHPAISATGTVNIEAGTYPIAITFLEQSGGESMQVYWSGPGIDRQLIPASAFTQVPPGPPAPSEASGLSYKYYEGGYSILPDFTSLTPVSTGSSSNFDLGIRRPGVNDSFAIVWEGYINIVNAGSYTFETISDDGSKLYINGVPIVNNDGTHPPQSATGNINFPTTGRYPIRVEYFENYGAESFQVYWSGPDLPRQQIPDNAFLEGNTTPPLSSGLNYKYYEGDFAVLPDFNALIPVKTGKSDNVDLTVRTPGRDDRFAFLWEGTINIPAAGIYTFETVSDDGSKLYFNTSYSSAAIPTVDNDGLHPANSSVGSVNIPTKGSYPIAITFFENSGDEQMQVYWSGPGIPRQLIPNVAFKPSSAVSTSNLRSTTVEGLMDEAKTKTKIYPNPFRESFNIEFYNSSAANNVQVRIYDLNGQLIYVRDAGNVAAGNVVLQVKPDARLLPGGVYVARLQINGISSKIVRVMKVK